MTDLSMIGGFGLDDDERSAANDRLGLPFSDDDYLYEMARRLREKGEHRIAAQETRDY